MLRLTGIAGIVLALISSLAQAKPEITELSSGMFMSNDHDGCVATFDKRGRRLSETDKCSDRELQHADDAVEEYRDRHRNSSNNTHHNSGHYWQIHGSSDNNVRLRESPSMSSDVLVSGIRNGTVLRGYGDCEEHHDHNWCEVQYEGKRGWVRKKYLNESSKSHYNGASGGGSSSNRHNNDHGNKARFADLEGERASSADYELRERGFRHVDSFKSGYTAYSIWYRKGSRQCVQMAVADGKADSIVDIKSHPKCH